MPIQDDTHTFIGQTQYRFQVPHEFPATIQHVGENMRAIDRVINGLPMPLFEEEIATSWFEFSPENESGVKPETGEWDVLLDETAEIEWDVPLTVVDGSDLKTVFDGENEIVKIDKAGLWQITPRAHIFVPSVIDRITARVTIVINAEDGPGAYKYNGGSASHYPGDNDQFAVGITRFIWLPKECTVTLRVWMKLWYETGEMGVALTTRFLEPAHDEAGGTGISAHWITSRGGGGPSDPTTPPPET